MGLRNWLRQASGRRAAVAEAADATGPARGTDVQRLGYEYGAGLTPSSARNAAAYSQERLQILNQLHQAYLTCPWVAAPVDLIARTVTAGGLKVVADTAEDGAVPGDTAEVGRLKRLLRYTNPREDMVQLLRSAVIDLNLFGDAFIEVVTLLGEPVALYTLDATTMTVVADDHGEVTGYVQQVDGSGGTRTAEFTTDQVIHISLDAPRGGLYGVSPAQKALLPVTAWLFAEATIKENFRRGDPPRIHVDLAHMSDTDVQRWREQYQVFNLGPKAVGTPVLTTNGGIVSVLDPRKVTDYLDTTRQLRDEIIACFGTPPGKLGIIESGNLGGGTAEGQDKALDLKTAIPTPTGWTTMGDLKVGDSVLDEAGHPCQVTGTYEVPDAESWRLHFSDGTFIDCCSDHLWVTWTEVDRKAYGRCLTTNSSAIPADWPNWRSKRGRGPGVRRTAEILETLESRPGFNNHSIPVTAPLELPEVDLPIDPYTLGAWLGDGTSVNGNITCGVGDEQIIDEIGEAGQRVNETPSARKSGRTPSYRVEGLRTRLRLADLLGDKHVPVEYLRASHGQRVALLQGLMDTDGGFSSGQQVLFRSTNENLADAVVELARSLGQKPVKAKGRAMLNGVDCGPQYGVTWTPTIQVFRLGRKAERWKPNKGNGLSLLQRTIVRAEKIPDRPMRCIRVDSPNHMYLAGEAMIPTHNTFRVNTVIPISNLVLEKVNFHLLQQGFGISGFHLEFGEIDYRDSKTVEDIRDMRLRNGTFTLNRVRDEVGEPKVPGGDDAVLVDRQNIVMWADMDAMSKAGVAAKLKGTALEPGEPEAGQPIDVTKPDPPDPVGAVPTRDPEDGPGLANDAIQGAAPRESAFDRDLRENVAAWESDYRARRRRALDELPRGRAGV